MHDPALGLDAETERRDVEEEDVLHLALQDAGLDGRADRDDLIGVDALVRLLAGDALDELLDRRHPRGTTDENDVVKVGGGQTGILDRLFERPAALLDEVLGELLELRAGQLQVEVLRAIGGGGNEREVDRRLLDGRELDLRLLGSLLQTLDRHLVD